MYAMLKRGLGVALLLWLGVTQAAPTFPNLSGRVVDEAKLLSPTTREAISAQLAAHEAATTNQVVVVTLSDLQGYNIEDYGYQLGRHWGIGQAERDNGVLLIVAPKERKVRIEVGYGLEGTLTDALSHDIIQNRILPRFRLQHYEAGITEGIEGILAVLAGSYRPVSGATPPKSQNQDLRVSTFISLFMFLLIVGEFSSVWLRGRLRSGLTLAAVAFLVGWIFISAAGGFILAMLVFLLHQFIGGGGGPGVSGGSGRHHNRYDYYGSGYGHSGGGYSGGGGFGGYSGGGGSFGGGGASGGW
jgi:uncharacterized protein